MLNSLELLRAMNGIHEEDVIMAEKNCFTRKHSGNPRRTVRITLLAAVLICLFAAGAYSLGFLGPKAIVIQESATEDGEALVSVTQPQAVPEEMSNEIREKVENARSAWDEWRTWRETSPDIPRMPEVFDAPKDTVICNEVANGDGSYTLSYYDQDGFALVRDGENGEPDFSAATPIEVRTVSPDDIAAREAWIQYVNLTYGSYDFNYDIHNELEAAKLEEIAAKYGLRLRGGSTLLWSRETVEETDAEMNARYGTNLHTDTSDPRYLSNRELCERISDVACHGALFREVPRGFDKVYYFDEGTFCISCDQELADGRRVSCYGYNSVYATLSSGREVVSRITDPELFRTRTHTAPDGTELTILQKDNEAFLYVYLPESFFEMQLHCETALSDADVDAVADRLNYGSIGK